MLYYPIVALMESVSTSETSVSFYHSTQRHVPEGSHLHTRRRENQTNPICKLSVGKTDSILADQEIHRILRNHKICYRVTRAHQWTYF
jgi:hypothetical protein